MKSVIVLVAVIPLLLVFMMQFTLDQKNNSRIGRFQDYVYAAKEQAKQEGCFTKANKDNLRSRIAKEFKVAESEILIEATEQVQYRVNYFNKPQAGARGIIHYKVSVPVDKLVAGNRFFGIKDEKNRGYYTVESYTASERLPLPAD